MVVKSELGKIFSMVASLEAAVPLFAAPLFTFVYNHTLDSFPGAVFLVQVVRVNALETKQPNKD